MTQNSCADALSVTMAVILKLAMVWSGRNMMMPFLHPRWCMLFKRAQRSPEIARAAVKRREREDEEFNTYG